MTLVRFSFGLYKPADALCSLCLRLQEITPLEFVFISICAHKENTIEV